MAQQRPNVPKFGNWESEENVPYTAYFDKPRKARTSGGKTVNPNGPEAEEPVRQLHEQMRSREEEEGEFKQSAEPPAARHGELANQQRHGSRGGGSLNEASNKRQGRTTSAIGSENNGYERSPLHNQARAPARNIGHPSPLWDGNKSSYDGTGRSKPRTNLKGDESPDKGAAVPKFGDWDENNPESAEGYTHIFNKVREERNYGGRVTGSARTPSRTSTRPPPDSTKCCCFSWGGK